MSVFLFLKEMKKEDEAAMTQSMMELRQQAEFLNTGNDGNRLMMDLETTAVDDWGAAMGDDGKKKVRFFNHSINMTACSSCNCNDFHVYSSAPYKHFTCTFGYATSNKV